MAVITKSQPAPTRSFHTKSGFAPIDHLFVWLLSLYGVVALAFLSLVPLRFLPAEDAVILFQYSRNLAQSGAISFLAGGPHVEGATDFAWMLLVAAGIRVGIPPLWLSAAANILSLFGIGWLLLRMANARLSLRNLLAVAGAAALFPQIFAAASGFAVLLDALLLTTLVFCISTSRVWAASTTAFVFCLFRPDGIVFAIPLLAFFLFEKSNRARSTLAIATAFIAPGVLYFCWRWLYFREFLPLPFLVKSDTHRLLGLVVAHSARSSLIFLVFSLLVLLSAQATKTQRNKWAALGLIVIPTLFYWRMRLDQNVGARFFYYLPLGTAILVALNWSRLAERRRLLYRTAWLGWVVLIAMPTYRELRTFRDEQFASVQAISADLATLPKQGRILTSEAGFLPYYSGWTTYDAWGLNTPEFAHRFFQPADVERLAPDLIVLHPDRTDSCIPGADWQDTYSDRSWQHLTRNLIRGAAPSRYQLWLTSYGSEYYRTRKHWQYGEGDRECWLVREDSPLRAAIGEILSRHHAVAPLEAHHLEEVHRGPEPKK